MTRQFVRCGASPRGAQSIILTAKIHAILDNRYHVATEDIRAVATDCLRHRILLNFEGQAENVKTEDVIANISGYGAQTAGCVKLDEPVTLVRRSACLSLTQIF